MTPFDTAELLRRCEALVPELAARAPEGEELRKLPDSVLDAAADADLFRAMTPASLGGHGLGLDAICQSPRVLAHGCPASAWVLSFLMLHTWLLSRFPAAARDEIFAAGPTPFAPAPLAPTGTVTPADGGFVLTGRWEWATGIEHADWVMVHAIETGPELGTRLAVVPRHEVEVDDVWFTSGMRATGSNTVRVSDLFVPEHRTMPAQAFLFDPEPVPGDGLAGYPVSAVLGLFAAAPALGAAEAAVTHFRQRLGERVLAYSLGDRQREQPAGQMRLAAAMSDLASAQARWNRGLDDLRNACATGGASEELRVACRLTAAATVRASRSVINTVCEASGASIYFSHAPLQRLQRDVEVLKGHVLFDWDRTTELAGRHALGFGLRITDMV